MAAALDWAAGEGFSAIMGRLNKEYQTPLEFRMRYLTHDIHSLTLHLRALMRAR